MGKEVVERLVKKMSFFRPPQDFAPEGAFSALKIYKIIIDNRYLRICTGRWHGSGLKESPVNHIRSRRHG
jgi:hypothetical protein